MLTEKALLRQPKKKYMSEEQIAYFKDLLDEQRQDIINGLKETNELLQGQSPEIDDNDRATQEEGRWLELRIRDREGKLLRKIDKALARIKEGAYGYCDDTGEEIGLQRLLIRPTASLSIDAKNRRESIEKGFSEVK